MGNEHIHLGFHELWGPRVPFSISCHDRRHHVSITGKSGVGKSTLLRNMMVQDIMAGRGIGIFDPHGDLANELLDLIPKSRVEDVVHFDPSDVDHPVGFNLVGRVPEPRRQLVASGIVSVFKAIWSDSWGPRLEYILYAAIAALLDCENVSLLGVPRMLTDEQYRYWVVKQVKNPIVRSFWTNEFARYDKRFLQEAISPILNKVNQLLMASELRNILGQVRSRVDARYMMDKGKIFIANLSKGKIGADKANLLGALWVTQFQLAAMSRADICEESRRDFTLYIDEFSSFVSDSFVSILSEARKYRLSLVLSAQYLAQIRPEILDAVLGNVGSQIAFRVGYRDAEALEAAFGKSISAPNFTTLGNGKVYAKILSDGRDLEPFMGRTHPPSGIRHGRRDHIIRRSRERYSSKKRDVERKINSWLKLPPI